MLPSLVFGQLLLIENSMLKFNTIQNRRCWIHEINLSRPRHGEFERLFKELRRYDDKFHSYLRMNQDSFEKLKAKLQKKDIAFRYSITPATFSHSLFSINTLLWCLFDGFQSGSFLKTAAIKTSSIVKSLGD